MVSLSFRKSRRKKKEIFKSIYIYVYYIYTLLQLLLYRILQFVSFLSLKKIYSTRLCYSHPSSNPICFSPLFRPLLLQRRSNKLLIIPDEREKTTTQVSRGYSDSAEIKRALSWRMEVAISQAIAGNIKPLRGGRFNPMLSRTSARRQEGGRECRAGGGGAGGGGRVYLKRECAPPAIHCLKLNGV